MLNRRRMRAARREFLAAERIPCSAHVTPHVVTSPSGDYLQAFRLAGASFESADEELLNTWHERLNVLWRNVASPRVALWAHLIRRRDRSPPGGITSGGFAGRLDARYRARLAAEALMSNELYLAIVYRPAWGMAAGLLSSVRGGFGRREPVAEAGPAIDACEKLGLTVRAALARYEPERLGCYQSGPLRCSTLLEYLGLLINGEWQRVPVSRGPLNAVLATTRPLFGAEFIEYRTPTARRLGAMLGIKEYPTPTAVGMFNRLLAADFPLVLTQSFAFLSKATGQGLLQRQIHRMANAGDYAVSQAEELSEALDALASNEFVMGDHHLSLQVMTDAVAGPDLIDRSAAIGRLNEQTAIARAVLADSGMTVAREDLALEAAFWAQLPGNFALRPRKAPISSRNFAAMAPFHNYPTGRATGNHWGDALTVLSTRAGSSYHFSLHAGEPGDAGGAAAGDTGHAMICGPTGSGKTVFIGFLVSMLALRTVTQVIFDKDRGLEILTRALGGEYLALQSGVPTGFNPLRLPASPANVEFLKSWLRSLVSPPGRPLPEARQLADLDQALRGTLALEASGRRLSRLVEFLDPTDADGVYARLLPWCDARPGGCGWVFDNAEDLIVSRMASCAVMGFDMTAVLDSGPVRSPVTLYLFHLVRQLLDGRRLVCWMDEFWKLIRDPAFEAFAKDGPKTWRKLNGVMCLATQSAGDVLDSPISRTIVEQTPTKVFFPNANAVASEYIQGLGLTAREFRLIKYQLSPASRRFLVKQGEQSIVCQLDLHGMDGELQVLSGRAQTLDCMSRVIAAEGGDPERWLPVFMRALDGLAA